MSQNQDRQKKKTLREKISPAWAAAIAVFAVSMAIGLSGPQGVWFGLSALGVIGSLLCMAYLWAEAPDQKGRGRKRAGQTVPDHPAGAAEPPKNASPALFTGPSHALASTLSGQELKRRLETLGLPAAASDLSDDTVRLLNLLFQPKAEIQYAYTPCRIADIPSGNVMETVDLLISPDGTAHLMVQRERTPELCYALIRPVSLAGFRDAAAADDLADWLTDMDRQFGVQFCQNNDGIIRETAGLLQVRNPQLLADRCRESLASMRASDFIHTTLQALQRQKEDALRRYSEGGLLNGKHGCLFEKTVSSQRLNERLTVCVHPRPDEHASWQQHWYEVQYTVSAAEQESGCRFERKARLGSFRQESVAKSLKELNGWLTLCRKTIREDSLPGQIPDVRSKAGRLTGGSLTLTENDSGLEALIAADTDDFSEYQHSPLETQKGVETEGVPWKDVLSVNNGPEQTVTLRRYATGVYALAFEAFRWPRTPSDSGGVELIRLEELPHDFPIGWSPDRFARTACQTDEARLACAGDPEVIRFFRNEAIGQNQ